ncbi:MATE family efflux transporter [Alkalihalobacillus trypoxylicola]|uniref:Probable multidrug resistance protein NorM n=1 Tax=Alkalihalobacillus trypoxylicola TaxID=519424 RepID=A0A161PFN3_9BACI|nr:MATE family efflux transporter [Alkalihalobacillus trypoxylicola]KYG31957.1 MATE family efflux transporter [Alkalihalobacillus trypoxylicola]
MFHAKTFKEKLGLFLTILWPIMVTQLSLHAMTLVDTIMSGRVGTDDLAGVAIGSSIWMPVFTGINGILLAVTPIVAQFLGRGENHKIRYSVNQFLYLSLILALLVILIGSLFLDPLLSLMNLDDAVHHVAFHYLIGLSTGIIPLFMFNVIRNFFDAQGFTRITMFITIIGVPLSALLNYALIFGNFGFPALGGIGAGYATGITYWVIFLISILMTFKISAMRHYKLFIQWAKPSISEWKKQLSIGVPIGLSIFFEASIFAVMTLLIGMMFSTITIAANQIALNFTTLIFMIPLSISMALTILVGYSVGGQKYKSAKQYTLVGVLGGAGILGIASIFLFLFREQIARLYSSDPQVIILAGQFFIIAIFYQISDAIQSSLQGVLRGYKDVKIPFIVAFTSYWIIGIPVGYTLAAFTSLGPKGFWIGITIGLTCAAIGFFVRLRYIQKQKSPEDLPSENFYTPIK